MIRKTILVQAAAVLVLCGSLQAQTQDRGWIATSNNYTSMLTAIRMERLGYVIVHRFPDRHAAG